MLNFLAETFLLGLKNLRLHKLRSLLTALGIILGVAAVIGMVAIGEGGKQQALEQINRLGAQNIRILSIKPPESNQASNRTQRVLDFGIRRVDLERLKTIPNVQTMVPLRDTEQTVILGDIKATANPIGTTPDIFDVINLKMARGSFFTWLQYDRGDAVCVLGSISARQLFPYQDPIGQAIQIGTSGMSCTICTVIGVLEPSGLRAGSEGAAMMGRDLDQGIYFPLTLARTTFGDSIIKRQAGTQERKIIELSDIWLKVNRIEDVERTAKIAENIMAAGHKNLNDVDVKAPIQILRAAEQQQRVFNYVMVMTASIALVVGGIGIMNIMLASVTERTREIGIRRALGAKQRHITLQFLIETTVISLMGGLIGVALGMSFAWLAEWASSHAYRTSVTLWSVVGSFLISGVIGIGFGLYPAMKAAQMNPIEALRHE